MQTIEYHGDSTVAVDGVLRELLDPDQWSPGDWYVEVTLADDSVVRGYLTDFERRIQQGCWVTIQLTDDQLIKVGADMRIETETIAKLVIP